MRSVLVVASILAAVPSFAQVGAYSNPGIVRTLPERVEVSAENAPALGPADAPVTIVEFCDFQCGHCANATQTLRAIRETWPNAVRIVWRDYPLLHLHPGAGLAAEAARCAGEQGRFWPMHDRLYASQARFDELTPRRLAQSIAGMDIDRFTTCMSSGRQTARWQDDHRLGESYGVTGTPTFFVNGRAMEGLDDPALLVRMVDEEVAQSRRR